MLPSFGFQSGGGIIPKNISRFFANKNSNKPNQTPAKNPATSQAGGTPP